MKQSIILSIVLSFCFVFMAFVSQEKQETKPVQNAKETKQVSKSKSAPLSFKKDIAPIIKRYCLPCHTEDMMNPSELYLDSYDNMMKGGKHGKPFLAGKPDSSNMIRKINAKPPFGDQMPLKRKLPFPADTLKMLRTWIEQGAKNN